jgi:hypothetical protein
MLCYVFLLSIIIIIIIISLPQSTAGHRPLQSLAISLDLLLLTSSSCQPSSANRYSTWSEGILHYVYLDAVSTPDIVYPSGYRFYGCYDQPLAISTTSATTHIPNISKLQHTNRVCYVGDFSSLPDHLVSESIPQRNPEHSSLHISLSDLKLVDQPCRECPRLGTVCHDR